MSTISVSPDELKTLIQSAVDNAFERHAADVRAEIEQEEITDHNLGRLVEEVRGNNEPTTAGEDFLANLKSRL